MLERHPMRATLLGTGLAIARALPQKTRRMVGPWVFLDHIGPVRFADGDGVNVGPHPHTALQTVTWLLAGELLHKDSLGYQQVIRPGELNLMTAGHGISHSEESPPGRPAAMHGVQFWVALPPTHADIAPAFEHHPALPVQQKGNTTLTVLMGELEGVRSPATSYWPMVGADIACAGADQLTLAIEPGFEHALLLLQGEATLDGETLPANELVYLGAGRSTLALQLRNNCHAILLGGQPFVEPVLMWWNFVAHSEAALRQAVADWEQRRARFGEVPAYTAGPRLDAPELPAGVRLTN